MQCEAEADRLCNAQRYERSEARRDTRAGHYERRLQTRAGEVRLKVPKLRAQTFETAIIERSAKPNVPRTWTLPRWSGAPKDMDGCSIDSRFKYF